MPMRFVTDLWRRKLGKKNTPVQSFPMQTTDVISSSLLLGNPIRGASATTTARPESADSVESVDSAASAPVSPLPWREPFATPLSTARPNTTDEETRPLCSAPALPAAETASGPTAAETDGPVAPEVSTAVAPEAAAATNTVAAGVLQPDFSAPLSAVLLGIEESFGQTTASSLQSSKWDKRVQALKAMSTVLKGLELGSIGSADVGKPSCLKGLRLRDRRSCWLTMCQALHYTIRDKVIPVRLISHEIFCDLFARADGVAPTELQHAAQALLTHLIDVLGDSNLRLHESARKCVLFCAEAPHLAGLPTVLSMCLQRLNELEPRSRDRAKVHFGILDAVNVLLQQSTSLSWAFEDVLHFVVAGMDDALGPRVRGNAVALAVTLRRACGKQSVGAILLGLRPAVQKLLRDRFQEIEDEETEDEENDSQVDPSQSAANFVPPPAGVLASLIISGTAITTPVRAVHTSTQSGAQQTLPGTIDDEDVLMDGILEETGAVFSSGGVAASMDRCNAPGVSCGYSSTSVLDELWLIGGLGEDDSEKLNLMNAGRNGMPGCGRRSRVRVSEAIEVY